MNMTIKGTLIVVDVQLDFCEAGALEVPRGGEVVKVINRCSMQFEHIVATQDWHPADHASFASLYPGKKPYDVIEAPYGKQVLWPDHCVQASRGAEMHPELDVARFELLLRKGFRRDIDSYSAFYENDQKTATGLAGYLRERGIERLYFAGLATDFCVLYSVLDARRLGFSVSVVADACRGIDLDGSLAAAWSAMLRAGAKRVDSSELSRHTE
ncbi:MAG: bifunctional nicotinamidase/pyrazinamidase [Deltaproteobacteria bacterium]|nr:bifunctional nicotinamidase/pyrazinamidase [Deltaproteobacteria bacterium]